MSINGKSNEKRSSLPKLRVQHLDAPVVDIFDNPLGQSQAESPTALLRRESRIEDSVSHTRIHASAIIAECYLYPAITSIDPSLNIDLSPVTRNRVESVFYEIFENPADEVRAAPDHGQFLEIDRYRRMYLE